MKKNVTFGLLAIILVFGLIGCNNFGNQDDSSTSVAENIGNESSWKLKIRQDAFDTFIKPYPETFIPPMTVNDIWISHYFGTYNGSVVVMLEGWLGYDRAYLFYTVADVSFIWNHHQWPHVWKDGKFHHGLQEAYDAGWLNKNDLEEIAVRHNIWW
jgi:hypothetical protein